MTRRSRHRWRGVSRWVGRPRGLPTHLDTRRATDGGCMQCDRNLGGQFFMSPGGQFRVSFDTMPRWQCGQPPSASVRAGPARFAAGATGAAAFRMSAKTPCTYSPVRRRVPRDASPSHPSRNETLVRRSASRPGAGAASRGDCFASLAMTGRRPPATGGRRGHRSRNHPSPQPPPSANGTAPAGDASPGGRPPAAGAAALPGCAGGHHAGGTTRPRQRRPTPHAPEAVARWRRTKSHPVPNETLLRPGQNRRG